jgi:hypothetical protein
MQIYECHIMGTLLFYSQIFICGKLTILNLLSLIISYILSFPVGFENIFFSYFGIEIF